MRRRRIPEQCVDAFVRELVLAYARLGALRPGTFGVWFFNGDGDLALIEELCAVGVFVDMGFLAGHQIGGILEVVEQELVQGTTLLVQDLDTITVTVVDEA